MVVGPTKIEPGPPDYKVRCSNQLSYGTNIEGAIIKTIFMERKSFYTLFNFLT